MYMPQNYYPNNYQYPTIAGRIVNDFSEIIPNDIPMDGRNAIFIKADMSEIQSRKWNQDGRILTLRYKPILDGVEPQVDNSTTKEEQVVVSANKEEIDALQSMVEELTARIDKLEKASKPRVRKEGANNE